jgi:hypothetical protein
MKITFDGFTQPVEQYVAGAADVPPQFIRAVIIACFKGVYTAPELTFIVEGITRNNATFS